MDHESRLLFEALQKLMCEGSEQVKVIGQELVSDQRNTPLPTRCRPNQLDFVFVAGPAVMATVDDGAITLARIRVGQRWCDEYWAVQAFCCTDFSSECESATRLFPLHCVRYCTCKISFRLRALGSVMAAYARNGRKSSAEFASCGVAQRLSEVLIIVHKRVPRRLA